MSSVVFYDPACPAPYDARTLREAGMGGSESSVVRIAEALDAIVIQHNRTQAEGRCRPPGRIDGVEHVVVVRYPEAVEGMLEEHPRAQTALWLQDRFRPGSKRSRGLVASAPRVARPRYVQVYSLSYVDEPLFFIERESHSWRSTPRRRRKSSGRSVPMTRTRARRGFRSRS